MCDRVTGSYSLGVGRTRAVFREHCLVVVAVAEEAVASSSSSSVLLVGTGVNASAFYSILAINMLEVRMRASGAGFLNR